MNTTFTFINSWQIVRLNFQRFGSLVCTFCGAIAALVVVANVANVDTLTNWGWIRSQDADMASFILPLINFFTVSGIILGVMVFVLTMPVNINQFCNLRLENNFILTKPLLLVEWVLGHLLSVFLLVVLPVVLWFYLFNWDLAPVLKELHTGEDSLWGYLEILLYMVFVSLVVSQVMKKKSVVYLFIFMFPVFVVISFFFILFSMYYFLYKFNPELSAGHDDLYNFSWAPWLCNLAVLGLVAWLASLRWKLGKWILLLLLFLSGVFFVFRLAHMASVDLSYELTLHSALISFENNGERSLATIASSYPY